MAVANETLVLDLIVWAGRQPRTYSQVMAAWGTSFPRFPVWEDAAHLGLVARAYSQQSGVTAVVTDAGRTLLPRPRTDARQELHRPRTSPTPPPPPHPPAPPADPTGTRT